MKKSDIFDNYAKIAEKNGWISSSKIANAKKDDAEALQKKVEKNPRWDSLSTEDIAKLYSNKIDRPKSMEYKDNIMEVAHPEKVVISPSYDKLNGLVENNNEQQNIIINKINRTPSGQLDNFKYAQQELVLSLVRIGNDLDNRNQEKLTKLADTCLNQLSKKNKISQGQVILGGLLVGTLAALWAQQHLPPHSDGIQQDIAKAQSELDDFISSSSHWYGMGYDYSDKLISIVQDIKAQLDRLSDQIKTIMPILDEMEAPATNNSLPPSTQSNITAAKAIQKFDDNMRGFFFPYFQKMINNFSSQVFKNEGTTHKGFLSQLIDSTNILHGGYGLIKDGFDDVANALKAINNDITGIVKLLGTAHDLAATKAAELAQAKAKFDKETHPDASAPKPANPSTPSSSMPNQPVSLTEPTSDQTETSTPAPAQPIEEESGLDQLLEKFTL